MLDQTLTRVQLLRRVPPHNAKDYVSYPAFIAERLLAAGYVRAVSDAENAELDSPRLYLPNGQPYHLARKD